MNTNKREWSMGLLIDKCIDERLRLLFPGYDCQTARFAKLAGLKNGRLLDAAEAAGFDILITVDQSIPDQQNLTRRRIALLILAINYLTTHRTSAIVDPWPANQPLSKKQSFTSPIPTTAETSW